MAVQILEKKGRTWTSYHRYFFRINGIDSELVEKMKLITLTKFWMEIVNC
jgi:hypothetical protein